MLSYFFGRRQSSDSDERMTDATETAATATQAPPAVAAAAAATAAEESPSTPLPPAVSQSIPSSPAAAAAVVISSQSQSPGRPAAAAAAAATQPQPQQQSTAKPFTERVEETMSAIKGNDMTNVRRLISEDASIAFGVSSEESNRQWGTNIFIFVCSYLRPADLLRYMISCQPNDEEKLRLVNSVNLRGQTALWTAAIKGSVDHMRVLLNELRADVSRAANNGCSPLYVACEFNHPEACNLLIEKGANLNQQSSDGCTALFIAAQKGHVEICKILIRAGADVSKPRNNGCSPLMVAAENGHESVCEVLLTLGKANVDQPRSDRCTPLWFAAQKGHTKVCKLLIQHGAVVTLTKETGCAPLMIAAENGHLECVKALLAANAPVDQPRNDRCTPLWFASMNGHKDVVQTLLDAGADPKLTRDTGCGALMIAAENGKLPIVQLLLARGVPVDQPRNDRCTPLWFASQNGHLEVCEALIKHGANILATKDTGCGPLMIAAENGHAEVCKLLIKSGAQVDQPRNDKTTPLYFAAMNNRRESCKVLLDAGANPLALDDTGCTPLHAAIKKSHWAMVKTLMEHGADGSESALRGKIASAELLDKASQIWKEVQEERQRKRSERRNGSRGSSRSSSPRFNPGKSSSSGNELKMQMEIDRLKREKASLEVELRGYRFREQWLPDFNVADTNMVRNMRILGNGPSSTVHLVEIHSPEVMRTNGNKPLLAAMKKQELPWDTRRRTALLSELDALKQCFHKNILPLRYIKVHDTFSLFVFMPVMNLCSAEECISGASPLCLQPEVYRSQLPIILTSIANGLHHLHSNAIIHGNLKPSNVLLSAELDAVAKSIVRIEQVRLSDAGIAKVDFSNCTQYTAPELKINAMQNRELEVNTAADIYSFGIMLGELLAQKKHTVERVARGIWLQGRQWDIDHHVKLFTEEELRSSEHNKSGIVVTPTLYKLYRQCTHIEPSNRPSLDRVIRLLSQQDAFSPPMAGAVSDATAEVQSQVLAPVGRSLLSSVQRKSKGQKQVNAMTVDQVKQWLLRLDPVKFEAYATAFAQNEIDGPALRLLTEKQLLEMGVTVMGHRNKIFAALDDLLSRE